MPTDNNSWDVWAKHVLKELERHNTVLEKYAGTMIQIEKDVTALKVKAGVWGGLTGLIGGALTSLGFYLRKG